LNETVYKDRRSLDQAVLALADSIQDDDPLRT
jgi:hypothetical protein